MFFGRFLRKFCLIPIKSLKMGSEKSELNSFNSKEVVLIAKIRVIIRKMDMPQAFKIF